ncbi:MAG TPA: protein-disulfide reductase DsbD domain-containing protein [Rhodocyclaceae bacterium]|nr:protein-disulfide reductase DsbD domain-containing protein [Rhodocyclaceae bacterium]
MHALAWLQRLTLLCFLVPGLGYAADTARTEQVKVRLIPERTVVQPGSQVLIGLEQKIIPHWHTYWLNPGDSGLATSITWQLPAGTSAGPILWPVPSRHKQGNLTNYGYSDRVLLLSAIQIPADAKPGSSLPIAAKANWLVCEEICIPQQAELNLTLKVAAQRGPVNREIQAAHAALPENAPWPASVSYAQDKLQLRIANPELVAGKLEEVWFYPFKWGKLAHGAPQAVSRDGDTLVLDLQAGDAPGTAGETLEGLLAVSEKSGRQTLTRGFNVRATDTGAALLPSGTSSAAAGTDTSLLAAMLLALAGGIILNLLPCVFPVLSIKALALIRHGAHAHRSTRLHGLAYTVGIILSFLVLAGLLLLLRAGGAQIGWGFQFQAPGFVLAMAWLMFAIGLSLSGVFTLGNSVAGLGEGLAEKSGYSGSFFTGVLATIVATPCTAPFMGVAIAYALAQPALHLVLVFASLGLGLALPYLLLCNWPLLQRCLPRPGLWMERLKQAFAFPMYATALWLAWVLVLQAGTDSLLIVFGGMLVIAIAAWLFDSTRHFATSKRRIATLLALALIIGAYVFGYLGLKPQLPAAQGASKESAGQYWETYSEARLQALRAEGKPVFLNFTAAWCITCLANERVALNKDKVINTFREQGITYLKGDWTNQDAAITQKLAEFGRSGVPLYVYYPADKHAQAVVLPQLLTPEIVLEYLSAHP